MKPQKKQGLEARGWSVGSAEAFLELTAEFGLGQEIVVEEGRGR